MMYLNFNRASSESQLIYVQINESLNDRISGPERTFLSREVFLEIEKEYHVDYLLGPNGVQKNPCLPYSNSELSFPVGQVICFLTYKAKIKNLLRSKKKFSLLEKKKPGCICSSRNNLGEVKAPGSDLKVGFIFH